MLRAADCALLGNKTSATRLGFAALLKLFQAEGHFPHRPEDVAAAVEATADQIGVAAAALQGYDWRGRTIESHRAQIHAAFTFREFALDDTEALGRWLKGQALALERRPERLLAVACERRQSQHGELPPKVSTGCQASAKRDCALTPKLSPVGVVQNLPFLGYTRHAETAGL